jgi:hypothetical protein
VIVKKEAAENDAAIANKKSCRNLDFLYMKFVKRRNKNESEVGREIRK